jgi:DNA repair and recombination protein RAD54B
MDFSTIRRPEHSGKLELLQAMLRYVHDRTLDKVVVASNFTKALDGVQAMCDAQGFKWLRLDGSTQCDKRQELVDRFNRGQRQAEAAGAGARAAPAAALVFLLSSKAGGTGLNIVGANRIVLVASRGFGRSQNKL